MRIVFIFLVLFFFLNACNEKKIGNPRVILETVYGEVELLLYENKAPITSRAFLQYIDSGWYDRASFYRVLHMYNQPSNAPKSFLIQGGIWKTNYALAKRIKGIKHESTQQTGIKHEAGIISIARGEPGTAGTEFFICIDNEPGLDFGGENVPDRQGYSAFGKVVKGMNIIRKIYEQKERNQYFDPPIIIFSIKRK